MELKLKDDVEKKTIERKPEDLSDDYIQGKTDLYSNKDDTTAINGTMYTNNPVKISTNVVAPTVSKDKNGFDVMGIVKWIVIAVIAVVGVKLIYGLVNPKSIDVTNYVNLEADEFAKKMDISLKPDSAMSTKIPHYCDGTVTVDSNEKIGVVYIDGKRKGIHTDDKKYNMFGIHIGDGEYKIEDNITFEYDEYFSVLNDMAGGNSTALFYYNTAKNDCLVITVNDKSARVVAMTYFNDYKLISKNLSGLDD